MSFFGKNRQIRSTEKFASPDYVKITFAGANGVSNGLANSITGSLQQTIEDLYVVGEPTVYFGVGPSTGTLELARYAECGQLFKGFDGSACGFVQSIALNGSGADACTCGGVDATFTGAQLANVGFQIQAGRTFIGESMSFKIADLA